MVYDKFGEQRKSDVRQWNCPSENPSQGVRQADVVDYRREVGRQREPDEHQTGVVRARRECKSVLLATDGVR